ncbi:MAG: substrate-binding domain-containing protein [Hyphomonadaceae bacterium]|nr:substrate-binding domain-containing protein [Hyphomonadaceae bacterium]
MKRLLLALALLCMVAPSRALAATIEELARAASGDTLTIAVHGLEGHEATVRAFQRRFPDLRVDVTVQNPSSLAPRIVAEQQNGIYAWDSWWGLTAAMNNVVLPAGGFEPITDYLVLPEVRDPAAWRAPEFQYTSDRGPFVFVHSVNLDATVLWNADVVRGLQLRNARDLLDPALRGRIALRDPSLANNGAFSMAALYREEGPDFIRRLLTEQRPVVIENTRQLTDGALRGDYAIVIGGSGDNLGKCRRYGGCRTVRALPFGAYLAARGVSVLKHPPHPNATRLWINWLLSREGQETYVREWAKHQDAGAASLRRDVSPDPRHIFAEPDYADLGRYYRPGTDAGNPDLAAVQKIYRESRARVPAPGSAWAVAIGSLVLLAVFLTRAASRALTRPRGH